MNTCTFCSIYAKQIPAKIIAENKSVFVINDIAPKAPIHCLIITKKHIVNIPSLTSSDREISADLLSMAQELSTILPNASEFRLISNNGAGAGQSVHHLHLHFLAGAHLPDFE